MVVPLLVPRHPHPAKNQHHGQTGSSSEGKNHKAELQLEQRSAEPEKNPKFSDFAVQYLEYSKANRPSYGVELYYIDRTLSPRFGHLGLKQITPYDVERFKQKRLRVA